MTSSLVKSLYEFWSSFGIPAYAEDGVPDNAVLPYITYSVVNPDWDSASSINARVWYRDTSYVSISSKLDEISDRIGDGLSIATENDMVILFKDDNFIQFQPYNDNTMKIAYLSMIIMHLR